MTIVLFLVNDRKHLALAVSRSSCWDTQEWPEVKFPEVQRSWLETQNLGTRPRGGEFLDMGKLMKPVLSIFGGQPFNFERFLWNHTFNFFFFLSNKAFTFGYKKPLCKYTGSASWMKRRGRPMKYCLIGGTTTHIEMLIRCRKWPVCFEWELDKVRGFLMDTRALKLCGVCIDRPLCVSEGTVTYLRSQKPEIEILFSRLPRWEFLLEPPSWELEKQYRPRNWLGNKNTEHTVKFESQINSEQYFLT